MKWIQGGVTAALGFRAAGVSAGIKRSRESDLALLVAEAPASAAGVFTTNRVKAAPVLVSQARLRTGHARAVLINSGCANCLTGSGGMRDALRISRRAARALSIPERAVLVASTGLIGSRLPVARVERAIPHLVRQLSRGHHTAAAHAILTTDLHPKEAAVSTAISGRTVRVGGMAKGAGMIAPSMATMLAMLTTDAAISPVLLGRLLRAAVEKTFNRISVDGDMSTNDTVFALASGRSGVAIHAGSSGERQLARMIEAVAGRLAALIVKDGEGASRTAEIRVVGARSDREAHACARQIAGSPLVKTMLAGADPNVGRIAAAAGASSARFNPDQLGIVIGGRRMVARGLALPLGGGSARALLKSPAVRIIVNLHAGRGEGRVLTCDLTEEYVRINARYAT